MPITVWHLEPPAGHDPAAGAGPVGGPGPGGGMLPASIAARLVHTLTRPRHHVVAFDRFPTLGAAARAAGCRPHTLPADPHGTPDPSTPLTAGRTARTEVLAGQVHLAVFAWPLRDPARAGEVLASCARLLSPDGHAVALLTDPDHADPLRHPPEIRAAGRHRRNEGLSEGRRAGPSGGVGLEPVADLIEAAAGYGLYYAQHIVVTHPARCRPEEPGAGLLLDLLVLVPAPLVTAA